MVVEVLKLKAFTYVSQIDLVIWADIIARVRFVWSVFFSCLTLKPFRVARLNKRKLCKSIKSTRNARESWVLNRKSTLSWFSIPGSAMISVGFRLVGAIDHKWHYLNGHSHPNGQQWNIAFPVHTPIEWIYFLFTSEAVLKWYLRPCFTDRVNPTGTNH